MQSIAKFNFQTMLHISKNGFAKERFQIKDGSRSQRPDDFVLYGLLAKKRKFSLKKYKNWSSEAPFFFSFIFLRSFYCNESKVKQLVPFEFLFVDSEKSSLGRNCPQKQFMCIVYFSTFSSILSRKGKNWRIIMKSCLETWLSHGFLVFLVHQVFE